MGDSLKEWKLIQAALGLFAACGLVLYIASGKFVVREWLPFIPTPAPPDTLLFRIDAMRQHFAAHRFAEALRESEIVLTRKKGYPEAIRVRAACLLRVGRFADAERVLRQHIGQNKFDLGARIDLALALHQQNKDDLARGVLLRLLEHPLLSEEQKQLAQNLLAAMDQTGLIPPMPEPSPLSLPSPIPSIAPVASPSPGLPPLTINLPRNKPEPPPVWASSTPVPTFQATPTPEIPAVELPKAPTPQPKVAATPEPEEKGLEIPVVDIDAAPTPVPTPRAIQPATLGFPRKILPATLGLPKKAPTKKAAGKTIRTGKKTPVAKKATQAQKSAVKKKLSKKKKPVVRRAASSKRGRGLVR